MAATDTIEIKKHIVFHPFLLVLAPIFALLYANIAEASLKDAVLPSIISLAAALVIYFIFKLILKDRVKAGLITSLAVVIFFSYGRVYGQILDLEVLGLVVGRHKVLIPAFAALFLVGLILLWQTDRKLIEFSRILNAFAAAWLVVVLAQVGYANVTQHFEKAQVNEIANADKGNRVAMAKTHKSDVKPDIYYLIFDRYAGAPALKRQLDFDNSDFENNLEDRGFYVASDSRSNYTVSQQSIASSLSLNYHETGSDSVFYEMLQDYRVWRFLKSQGYDFYHFGSWWKTIRENRYADYNFPYEEYMAGGSSAKGLFSDTEEGSFPLMLLKTTAAAAASGSGSSPKGDKYDGIRVALLKKFDALGSIPQKKNPKFVFAHMLIPHEPYLFDAEGETLSPEEAAEVGEEELYVNYIKFANKMIENMVDEILANSENPPIIIIQADEGFKPSRRFKEEGNGEDQSIWLKQNDDDLDLHLNILNAYHLPDFDESQLYKSISPVNSFRLVFNYYFGTDYPLLKDESLIYDYGRKKWVDITDRARVR